MCIGPFRDVASGPAGPVLVGPDFLKFKTGRFAHVSDLGGGSLTIKQQLHCKLT